MWSDFSFPFHRMRNSTFWWTSWIQTIMWRFDVIRFILILFCHIALFGQIWTCMSNKLLHFELHESEYCSTLRTYDADCTVTAFWKEILPQSQAAEVRSSRLDQFPFSVSRYTFNKSCKKQKHGPCLWSSGQSSWRQIRRSRVRFPALPDFLSSGSGTGSTQPREDNWGATWMEK
jgi:hypothetical protein